MIERLWLLWGVSERGKKLGGKKASLTLPGDKRRLRQGKGPTFDSFIAQLCERKKKEEKERADMPGVKLPVCRRTVDFGLSHRPEKRKTAAHWERRKEHWSKSQQMTRSTSTEVQKTSRERKVNQRNQPSKPPGGKVANTSANHWHVDQKGKPVL